MITCSFTDCKRGAVYLQCRAIMKPAVFCDVHVDHSLELYLLMKPPHGDREYHKSLTEDQSIRAEIHDLFARMDTQEKEAGLLFQTMHQVESRLDALAESEDEQDGRLDNLEKRIDGSVDREEYNGLNTRLKSIELLDGRIARVEGRVHRTENRLDVVQGG